MQNPNKPQPRSSKEDSPTYSSIDEALEAFPIFGLALQGWQDLFLEVEDVDDYLACLKQRLGKRLFPDQCSKSKELE